MSDREIIAALEKRIKENEKAIRGIQKLLLDIADKLGMQIYR